MPNQGNLLSYCSSPVKAHHEIARPQKKYKPKCRIEYRKCWTALRQIKRQLPDRDMDVPDRANKLPDPLFRVPSHRQITLRNVNFLLNSIFVKKNYDFLT
ncbi:hypothetical protein AMTR_s00122p00131770 [Amborella trichopoda]|uniref:Uncharacterized protein n=1 Tax=Amborella trichopoda TaxID=13333 RepID=W1NPS6_AMBTC|nr:hypothetical protein AMTR_s00122p00131770 [Amborella trichopoda]